MAVMAGIIACQTLTSGRRQVGLVLTEIILLGISVAWSQLLIFPSLLGVDPWVHSALTTDIVTFGSIPEGYVYSRLPLFHLMIVASMLLTGLSYKFATMVSVSLGQIVCIGIFVYLITKTLFRNSRIGLLAALLVIVANYQIFMSYWSIPNAYAAIFIPIVLYLSFFKFEGRSNACSILLFTILFAVIILAHTITAVCMGIVLVIIWVIPIFYRIIHQQSESYVSLLIPIGFIIAMLAWWGYASGSLHSVGNLIDFGFSADTFVQTSDLVKNLATAVPLEEQLIGYLGLFLFFAISFIGFFYMISKKGNASTFTLAWVGIAPLAIGFFSLISGHTVIEERWWYFAQILLSIPLAVAIYAIGTWKFTNKKLLFCFIFGTVMILSSLMFISPTANVDNHTFLPMTGSTAAYTQSEMVATHFFASKSVGEISSNSDLSTNPSSSLFINVYQISPNRMNNLDTSLITGNYPKDGSMKIFRTRWLSEPLKSGGYSLWIRPDFNEYISGLGFNRVYENPLMTGYIG